MDRSRLHARRALFHEIVSICRDKHAVICQQSEASIESLSIRARRSESVQIDLYIPHIVRIFLSCSHRYSCVILLLTDGEYDSRARSIKPSGIWCSSRDYSPTLLYIRVLCCIPVVSIKPFYMVAISFAIFHNNLFQFLLLINEARKSPVNLAVFLKYHALFEEL